FAGVAAGNTGVRVGDIREETRFRGLRPYAGFDEVVSYLAVPVLASDGSPYGALMLGHPDPDRFDERAQAAVTALTAHLGAALENLRTVNRLAELEATQREVVHQLQDAVRPVTPDVEHADGLGAAQSPDLAATALIARYRPDDGTVELVGAGHPPALVVSAEGKTRFVTAPGIPVGWPGAGSDEVVSFTLERSEVLVLYTDGLVEATKD